MREMADVHHIRERPIPDLKALLSKEFADRFESGDSVAVKAHLGEYGNLAYLRPPLLEAVVACLKETGAEPFIFDTTTWYRAKRHSPDDYADCARKNGFSEETMGCSLVFSDESVKKPGLRHYEEVGVAQPLAEADGMVTVSHVKGHEDASFGGAIKNLGMGGVDVTAKMQGHVLSRPELVGACTGCGTCVEVCPYGSMRVEGQMVSINENGCFGCNACVRVCPQDALAPKTANVRELIAEAAAVVLATFQKEKLYYVNVLMDVTKHCDCLPHRGDDFGTTLCPDLGILAGSDIAAIDAASLDLINQATKTENIFLELNKTDPYEQVTSIEAFGCGRRTYTLQDN